MIIWLASYPRSGNTYIRIILRHAFGVKTYSIYGDKFDIAADEATKEVVGHQELPDNFDYQEASKSSEIYFIKTHAPYVEDFKNDKAIYILRDGREAIVSHYYYINDYYSRKISFLEIINGYTFAGVWGDHYYSWLRENKESVLFLRFEDIISSPESAINKIAKFTGLKPQKIKIPKFNDLRDINPKFFRSGRKDSFKKELSEFEQEYFWLVNGPLMREAGYVDNVPEFNNERELEKLFLVHTDLTKNKKLKFYEDKIQVINQQLEAKEQQLANKNIVIQQKDQRIQEIKERLTHKNNQLQEKIQKIQQAQEQINQRDNQLQEKAQIIQDQDNQLQQKAKLIESKDVQLQQIERQLQEMKNSYSFRIGKIVIFPLSILKNIFSNLK